MKDQCSRTDDIGEIKDDLKDIKKDIRILLEHKWKTEEKLKSQASINGSVWGIISSLIVSFVSFFILKSLK